MPDKRTWGAGRTVRLFVRLSPAEHAAYAAHAERWGLSVSEWARDVLSAQLASMGGEGIRLNPRS